MPTLGTRIRNLNSVIRKHKLRWKRRKDLPQLAPRVPLGIRTGRSEIGTQDEGN